MSGQPDFSDYTTGIDEAGRGPLAGPVVAAAVSWPDRLAASPLVRDSKKLSPKKREQAFQYIIENAIDVSYFASGPGHIDIVNIRQATLHAMYKSFELLNKKSIKIFIDGNDTPPELSCLGAQSVIKGDSLVPAISCASIVAKVIRDRMMLFYDEVYPHYGFVKHKGYGTKAHYEAIREHGPSVIHRKSFKLVL